MAYGHKTSPPPSTCFYTEPQGHLREMYQSLLAINPYQTIDQSINYQQTDPFCALVPGMGSVYARCLV